MMKILLIGLALIAASFSAYSQDKWLFSTMDNNHLMFIQSGFKHENTQNSKERILIEYVQEKSEQGTYNRVLFTYNPVTDKPWSYEVETTSEALYHQYQAAFKEVKPLTKEGWESSYSAGNGTYTVSFKTGMKNGMKMYVMLVSLSKK